MRGVAGGFTTLKTAIKFFSVWIFAFMVPRFYVWYHQPALAVQPAFIACHNGVVPGADLLFALRTKAGSKAPTTIGLITGDTTRLGSCATTADFLLKNGLRVKKVFTPWQAGAFGRTVSIGKGRKIPVVRIAQDGAFTKQQLSGVDVLVFAMQDSRLAHGAYAAMLAKTMCAATLYKKKVVIMDHHRDDLASWGSLKKYALGAGAAEGDVHTPLSHVIFM